MHEIRVQRELIAYIRRHAPKEYAIWRAELKREFAELMAATPEVPLRRYFAQQYRIHKAAMVIATARYIYLHQ